MKKLLSLLISVMVLSLSFSHISIAETPKNKGLFITPVREYLTVTAGEAITGKLTIANLTDQSTDIDLSVEQFTVSDFTYDYIFKPSKKDWITLQTNHLSLQKNKSQEITYTIHTPADAAPGGYYFTLFATKTVDTDHARRVRVGEALYVTVKGDIRLTSKIQKQQITLLSFGGNIPFTFDIKDTGNTHFLVYVSGKLEGFYATTKSEEKAHLLMPNIVRTISHEIPPPVLPGVYKAIYGYRVDDGQIIMKSSYIIFLPPWFLLVAVGLFWLGFTLWKRHKRLAPKKSLIDS
jgi:hypothetical protein